MNSPKTLSVDEYFQCYRCLFHLTFFNKQTLESSENTRSKRLLLGKEIWRLCYCFPGRLRRYIYESACARYHVTFLRNNLNVRVPMAKNDKNVSEKQDDTNYLLATLSTG